MGQLSDIERLIELGLHRYGAGDLDGALLMWEEALAIDPDNEQATSYVDYLRQHFDVLSGGELSVEDEPGTRFAIEEEPDYKITEPPPSASDASDLAQAASVIALSEDLDAGWDVEETFSSAAVLPETAEPPLQLELEGEVESEPELQREPVNFEDATREYHGVTQQLAEPILPKPSVPAAPDDFAAEEFTGGFSSTNTSVRKRDLGFVQPTAVSGTIGSESETVESASLYQTQERATRYEPRGIDLDDPALETEDLFASLPTPRPAAQEPESGEIILPKGQLTRDMPVPQVPARLDTESLSQAEVMLQHAQTRELVPGELGRPLDPMISAPTRELGLRPGGKPMNPLEEEDIPTGQTDVRKLREASARAENKTPVPPAGEGTRHDIVLPFDPLVAQSAQILDDVDAEAPADESREDTTRRRITRLLELAGDWSESGELDKAVSAVDLALSEDPNSALGQKLITRNKDTIMSLFQSYLGDLDRMPQLAKPLSELANAPISPRAAFLLSRIDGTLTIDELLDVSGMPRLEAYRHLCQLFLRGILR